MPENVLQIPRAFNEILTKRARYKGYFGGRGSAKSRSFAAAAIIKASEKVPKRILCCREIQRSIRESVKHSLDNVIAAAGLRNFFESTQTEIRGVNGSQFLFEGLRSNINAIQSLEDIDIVWVEEANTVSQTSLDILIPTIRKKGSECWFGWNPRFKTDPVDVMFRGPGANVEGVECPPEYDEWMIGREVNYVDNPFFPSVLQAELERDKRRDPDRYSHVWLGHYASRSVAAVFRNWKIGTMEVPPATIPRYGADWGFSIDPTVLVRCFVFPDKRLLYVDAEVSGVGIEIDRTPAFFDGIANGPDDPLHPRKWPIIADSARPETISHMRNHGFPRIESARKGPGSIQEGVEFLKAYDIIVHPNCRRVIDELTLYSYEIDKLTNEVLPVLADENNNTIDALRYSVEALRRAVPLIAPILVMTPSRSYGDYPG